jgi:hypothetical protein
LPKRYGLNGIDPVESGLLATQSLSSVGEKFLFAVDNVGRALGTERICIRLRSIHEVDLHSPRGTSACNRESARPASSIEARIGFRTPSDLKANRVEQARFGLLDQQAAAD